MSSNNTKATFLIIDFEATCSNDKKEIPSNEMEIIEFAGILIDSNYKILDEFTQFIKPVKHPKLTKFCTELTTITQNDVDKAKSFSEVLNLFKTDFLRPNALFLSWGYYDKNQLLKDCEFHNVKYPFDLDNHVNIKLKVNQHLNLSKPKGIGGVLKYLNLRFEGTPHRGIDDVRNIVRILKHTKYPLNELSKS